MERRRFVTPALGVALVVAACSGSDDGVAKPDSTATDTGGNNVASADVVLDQIPDCRTDGPIAVDWCELSGEAPNGGSVHVVGPTVPISFQPSDTTYTVRVPLGVHDDPEFSVTISDGNGTVTQEETISVTREYSDGPIQVAGVVREPAATGAPSFTGESIPRAEVTIAGRTVTADETGRYEIGTFRQDGEGQLVVDEESNEYIVDNGVSPAADLIHVAADGYIGRLESIGSLRARAAAEDPAGSAIPSTGNQIHLDLQLDPVSDAVPVQQGDKEVRLSDWARIQFGPDGAPTDTSVALTEMPRTGTALESFGVPYADISAVQLGSSASLRVALDSAVASDDEVNGPRTITLWEPTTATQRTVDAHVETGAGELVISLDEIRGEVVWVSTGVAEIQRTVLDTEETLTEEHVPSALRECGRPLVDLTVRHVAEWEPESTSKAGEEVLLYLGIAERPERIVVEFVVPKNEFISPPGIFVKRTLERARYEFVSDFDKETLAGILQKYGPKSPMPDILQNGFQPFDRVEMVDAELSDAEGNQLTTIEATDGLEPATDCDLVGNWILTTGDAPLLLIPLSPAIEIVAIPGTNPRQFTLESKHNCGTDTIVLTEDVESDSSHTFLETVESTWTCEATGEECCTYNPTTWALDQGGVLHRVWSGTQHNVYGVPLRDFLARSTWAPQDA